MGHVPLRFPRGLPPPSADTEAGGGATLSGRVGRDPLDVPFAFTEVGGGATTSVGPKIRPIKLPMSDPLAEVDGGGGVAGETLAKVKAAALEEVPNATIVRVETDADGHAAYEAHILKADGTPATVYVDEQFDVVSVESR